MVPCSRSSMEGARAIRPTVRMNAISSHLPRSQSPTHRFARARVCAGRPDRLNDTWLNAEPDVVIIGLSQSRVTLEQKSLPGVNPGRVSIGFPCLLADARIAGLLFQKEAGLNFNMVSLGVAPA